MALKALLLLVLAAAAAAKPRMGVCLTGQLKRMEFWSKIHHLLVPNKQYYDIDVFFVMDPDSIVAVNERKFLGVPTVVLNETEIRDAVKRYCPECGVVVRFQQQPKTPSLVTAYLNDLAKYMRTNSSVIAKRATVHDRLLYSWASCYREFKSNPSVRYDVLLRLRDDLFVAKPWFVDPQIWTGAVNVKLGCDWEGYNDKGAIVDARYGYEYFAGPLNNMMLFYREMRNQTLIKNSETILRASLTYDRVPVRKVPPENFPFIVTRRKPDGSVCFADVMQKRGRKMSCIAPSALKLFQRYRCKGNRGFQDTDQFWAAREEIEALWDLEDEAERQRLAKITTLRDRLAFSLIDTSMT